MGFDFLFMKKVKNGDREAGEEFIKKYYAAIYQYCFLHIHDRNDAEDMAQETYGQYYFAMALCAYIASLFAASLTMLVTAKMHSRNVAAGIPFFLYCLMPFIGRALSSFTTFFNLMPYVLLNIMESAKDPLVFQLGNVVFRQIPLVMLLYVILSMLLLPFVYRSFGQYGLKK